VVAAVLCSASVDGGHLGLENVDDHLCHQDFVSADEMLAATATARAVIASDLAVSLLYLVTAVE
jgi:hypothetical protein